MTGERPLDEGVLVFSIALNGYGGIWRSCIRSHRTYARRWGFHYACVELPWTVPPGEAAWLKVPLIVRALEHGRHAWVLFLDADALVRAHCPDFRRVAVPGRDVYLAPGHSGRVNSGVIMARRSAESLRFFRGIVADCESAVLAEDAAPYENGHVIKHARASRLVGLVERQWNNTADPGLDDYVRHFTGPMSVQCGVSHRARRRWQQAGALRNRVRALWTPRLPDGTLRARLDLLAAAAASRYHVFGGPRGRAPGGHG
jgi:hypothetical protein